MIIRFVGICAFDMAGITGATRQAFIPDVSVVPPSASGARSHTAFIAAPPGSVNSVGWGPGAAVSVPAFRDQTFELYPLGGDDVSFTPAPTGGVTEISNLPSARVIAIGAFPNATLRVNLTDPSPVGIAARVLIPGGDLTARIDGNDLQFTELVVNDNVTITAMKFGGATRSLTVQDATLGPIIIANVDNVLPTVNDYVDRKLYFPLFDNTTPPMSASVSARKAAPKRRPFVLPDKVVRPTPGGNRTADFTLGPGCSNSQLP